MQYGTRMGNACKYNEQLATGNLPGQHMTLGSALFANAASKPTMMMRGIINSRPD
jgi:hypothetical protein